MDMLDGIIVGVAVTAIGTVIAFKYLTPKPVGGAQPNQPIYAGNPEIGRPAPLYVVDLVPTPGSAAPVAQVNPITEAAYNVQPVPFEHAFGPGVNQPTESALLPQ